MKTNATILAAATGQKTVPTMNVEHVTSIGIASYNEPWGVYHIPPPEIYWPNNVNLEFCIWKNTTEHNLDGLLVKIRIDPELVAYYASLQAEIVTSGDKAFRIYESAIASLIPFGQGTNIFTVNQRLRGFNIQSNTQFMNLTIPQRIAYCMLERFFRIRLWYEGYCSAFSALSSFTVSFRKAERVPQLYFPDTDETLYNEMETGWFHDGQFYY